MRAVRFHELGDCEVLRVEDVPDPKPGPGEMLIRVHAVGVNFADTLFRRGKYFQKAVFPQIPGMECAGEILELGAGTEGNGFKIGDRVMSFASNAYAEKATCAFGQAYKLPDGLSYVQGAALPVQGLTAHHLLGLSGRFKAGESILVHAAAGGVGLLAVQLAKIRGARTIVATAGDDVKFALAKEHGAHAAFSYRDEAWAAKVKEAAGGRGIDLICEMVGGTEMYKRNSSCLAPFGRVVVYGAAGGDTHGTIEPVALMGKNHSYIGYYLTPVIRDRALCAPAMDELATLTLRGDLKIHIGLTLPLKEAARAHREMEARATTGKIVLTA